MTLRIANNINALNSHNQLIKNDVAMAQSLQRLSSGFRINSSTDKPAGLVISEQLRAQIAGLDQALENLQRANNILGTAEGALTEMSTLLNRMRSLAVESSSTGGVDTDQVQANQDEIDSALATIDRIANSTKFAGKRLLDGSQAFHQVSSATAGITDFTIRGAQFGAASTIALVVNVTAQSQRATAGAALANSESVDSTIRLAGKLGTEIFSFASGMTRGQVVTAINALTANTGVFASTSGQLFSAEFGDDAFISIESLEGSFSVADVNISRGTDVTASVNGMSGSTSGNFLNVNSTFFSGQVEMSGGNASTGGAATGSYTFMLQESGMKFQFGSDTVPSEQRRIGISNMHSSNLGRASLSDNNTESGYLSSLISGGSSSLATDSDSAVKIIDFAIADVNRVRSELGAFNKNTIEATMNNLHDHIVNIRDSESRIRDLDFAAEMMEFTKSQILMQSGTAMFSQSNTTANMVLGLLN